MKPLPFLIVLGAGLLSAATLHAEDAAPAKAEPVLEPYQLKNRSSFACEVQDARAPFWPIGWVHRKGAGSAVATNEAPREVLEPKNFRVTSILLGTGGGSLAVVNGRAYGEGEFLRTPRMAPGAPAAARTRVHQIADGFVVLQRETQLVTVALLRAELAQKKFEEPLLDGDR